MPEESPRTTNQFRKFGNYLVGDIPWGTHLCQFYESKQDLIDILVPYFAEGLNSNEFCMWVTSPPLEVKEAKQALAKAVSNIDDYLRKGQLEVMSYNDWYLQSGKFDADRVLQGWVDKEKKALESGFEGLRLSGNTFWVERSLWQNFASYEKTVNSIIGKHKMLALCTYRLSNCSGTDVVDVVRNHVGALIKQGKKWVLVEDVVHRKKAEQELWNAKTDWERTFDAIPDFIAILDNKFRIVRVNLAMAKQLGVSPEDAVGLKCYECVHGTASPPNYCPHAQLLRDGKEHSSEVFEDRLGGDFLVSTTPLVDENKKLIGCVHVARNITHRKKAEDDLKRSEQRWITTVSSIGDGVITTNLDGNVTFLNSVAQELTGWKLNEALQKPLKEVFNIVNEFSRKEVENPVSRVLKEGTIVGLANHTLLIKKNGEEIPVDDSGAPIKDKDGHVSGVVLVFRDITVRKKMEKELISLAKFPSENPNIVLRVDKSGVILYANPGSQNLLYQIKLEPGDLIQEPWLSNITEAFSTNSKIVFEEKVGERVFLFNTAPILQEGYVNVYGIDITERKKAEEALKESEERFSKAFNANPNPILIQRVSNTIFVDTNEAYLHLFGFKKHEIIGHTAAELGIVIDPKVRAEIISGSKQHKIASNESVFMTRRGEHRYLLISTAIITFNGEDHFLSILTDITERKKSEEDLRERTQQLEVSQKKLEENAFQLEEYASQMEDLAKARLEQLKDAERLAAIGATAGMVGHDIRNPLQSIMNDLYLAKIDLSDLPDSEQKESILESVRAIEQSVDYVNKIVQDLQDFAKQIKPTKKETEVEELISLVISKSNLLPNIKVKTKVQKEANTIITDPDLLRRIISNLVSNAFQAMPNGGKLDIDVYMERESVVISVSDSGHGIPEDARDKLFTPLFTTKSKGQGFGLAVVKRITEALDGSVSFESEVGKGTKFILKFPKSSKV